jgi:hypothetical protein
MHPDVAVLSTHDPWEGLGTLWQSSSFKLLAAHDYALAVGYFYVGTLTVSTLVSMREEQSSFNGFEVHPPEAFLQTNSTKRPVGIEALSNPLCQTILEKTTNSRYCCSS